MKRTQLLLPLKRMLNQAKYGVIATVSPDGTPWNTPVAVSFDNELNLYWGSAHASQHSRNIVANSAVFVVVFGHQGSEFEAQGLYLRMQARELNTVRDIKAALKHCDTEFFESYKPNIDYTGDCPTRIYKAEPQQIWRNIDSTQNGYFVDVREPLEDTSKSARVSK